MKIVIMIADYQVSGQKEPWKKGSEQRCGDALADSLIEEGKASLKVEKSPKEDDEK